MTPERYEKLKFDLWMSFNTGQRADWFTAHLFRLFRKADLRNRDRLRLGFPDEWQVFFDWWTAEDERVFFGPELVARGEAARKDLVDSDGA